MFPHELVPLRPPRACLCFHHEIAFPNVTLSIRTFSGPLRWLSVELTARLSLAKRQVWGWSYNDEDKATGERFVESKVTLTFPFLMHRHAHGWTQLLLQVAPTSKQEVRFDNFNHQSTRSPSGWSFYLSTSVLDNRLIIVRLKIIVNRPF